MKRNKLSISWAANVPVIIDQRLLEIMDAGGPRKIDAFLFPWVRHLKDEYKRTGNPVIIYQIGSSVSDKIVLLQCCHYSFQFSQLQGLLAEMLLAHGKDASSLRTAVCCLETAIETAQRVGVINDKIVRAHVFYALLLGIARKALGHFDESLKGMRNTAKDLVCKSAATDIDLISLRRQEIMMHQTVAGHEQLAEEAIQYAALQPLEYYRSLKRAFEFFLNQGAQQNSEQIYPEFKRAFAAISQKTALISRISFMKNIGQYYMTIGEAKVAADVFDRTLLIASQLNLRGQVRQVKRLMQEIESDNNKGKLVTFRAVS